MSENTIVDLMQILPDGAIQIRQVGPDGYHRHVLEPGQDLTGQDERVTAIATAAWTPEVVSAYAAVKAAKIAAMEALMAAADPEGESP